MAKEVCSIVYYRGGLHCHSEACKELVWFKKFLEEFEFVNCLLLVDNKNPTLHSRSKHIDARYY